MENSATEASKAKRKQFGVLEKLAIIKDYDKLKSVPQTSEKYKVNERTLRGWIKNRDVFQNQANTYILTSETKRLKLSPLDELDDALYIWFNLSVKKGIPLNGPLIKGKSQF